MKQTFDEYYEENLKHLDTRCAIAQLLYDYETKEGLIKGETKGYYLFRADEVLEIIKRKELKK